MPEHRNAQGSQKEGLSVRQLTLLFLAGVAVCAVFFALGFVLGYNERPSAHVTESEEVSGSSSIIPPVINRPMNNDQQPAPAAGNPAGKTDEPQTEHLSGTKESSSPPHRAPDSKESPGPKPTIAEATSSVEGGIILQVVASSSHKDAENLVATLKSRGYPAFLVSPQQAHASDNLFRVQVGPFSTRQNAEKFRKKLSDEGFHPFFRR
jgi:cell division septation protein DedD